MPIIGKCEKCGYETLDDHCLNCIMQEREDLVGQLRDAKDQSLVSSVPCPLCDYSDGKLLKGCSMHETIEELSGQIDDLTKGKAVAELQIGEFKKVLSLAQGRMKTPEEIAEDIYEAAKFHSDSSDFISEAAPVISKAIAGLQLQAQSLRDLYSRWQSGETGEDTYVDGEDDDLIVQPDDDFDEAAPTEGGDGH